MSDTSHAPTAVHNGRKSAVGANETGAKEGSGAVTDVG